MSRWHFRSVSRPGSCGITPSPERRVADVREEVVIGQEQDPLLRAKEKGPG